MDPNAQGQHEAAVTPNQEQNQGTAPSGVEARIGELTAKFRDAERQMAVLQERENQYLSLIQQLTTTQTAPDPKQEVPVSPEMAAAIEAKTLPYIQRLEKMVQGLESQLAASQVGQMAPAMNLPPQVETLAKQALSDWKRRGIPGTVEDAIDWAWGRVSRMDAQEKAKSGNTRQQFQGGSPVVSQHGMPSSVGVAAPSARPANFDRLSPAQQIAWFEQNRNGGDMPL